MRNGGRKELSGRRVCGDTTIAADHANLLEPLEP